MTLCRFARCPNEPTQQIEHPNGYLEYRCEEHAIIVRQLVPPQAASVPRSKEPT